MEKGLGRVLPLSESQSVVLFPKTTEPNIKQHKYGFYTSGKVNIVVSHICKSVDPGGSATMGRRSLTL